MNESLGRMLCSGNEKAGLWVSHSVPCLGVLIVPNSISIHFKAKVVHVRDFPGLPVFQHLHTIAGVSGSIPGWG